MLKMSFPVLREPVKYCLADFFSKGGGGGEGTQKHLFIYLFLVFFVHLKTHLIPY